MKTSKVPDHETETSSPFHTIDVCPKSGRGVLYDVNTWPPVSKLRIYASDGRLLKTITKSGEDLADAIMLWDRNNSDLIYGFSVRSTKWKVWNQNTLKAIERFLVADFAHDALTLDLERIEGEGLPCAEEARWAIKVG